MQTVTATVNIPGKLSAPCKDCSSRQVGCHSICHDYIDYSMLNLERNAMVRTAKDVDTGLTDLAISGRYKYLRSHGAKHR
jgi:hypothetical protein